MMVLLDTHTPIPSRWASDRLNDDDDCDNCPPLHRCLVGSWDFELHHRIVHETASNKAGLGLYGTKRSNTKRNVARKQIIKKKKGGLRPETTFFFFFFFSLLCPRWANNRRGGLDPESISLWAGFAQATGSNNSTFD